MKGARCRLRCITAAYYQGEGKCGRYILLCNVLDERLRQGYSRRLLSLTSIRNTRSYGVMQASHAPARRSVACNNTQPLHRMTHKTHKRNITSKLDSIQFRKCCHNWYLPFMWWILGIELFSKFVWFQCSRSSPDIAMHC